MRKKQRFWDNDRFINALYYIAMAALVGWYAYIKGWILADFPFLSPQEALRTIYDEDNLTVLDVRTDEEFKLGYIQGARHIPLDELEKRLSEIPKDKKVLVYCNSGNRSISASRILKKHGYAPMNVKEGIIGLAKAGAPLQLPENTKALHPKR